MWWVYKKRWMFLVEWSRGQPAGFPRIRCLRLLLSCSSGRMPACLPHLLSPPHPDPPPPQPPPPPPAVIVASIMALEGKGGEAPARLRRDLPDMMRSNWALWVPFQFVNFRFVPPSLQVCARRRGGRGTGGGRRGIGVSCGVVGRLGGGPAAAVGWGPRTPEVAGPSGLAAAPPPG